nr:C1 family peptidase [bacterium]
MKTLVWGSATVLLLATAPISRPAPLREVDIEQLRGTPRSGTGDLGVMRPDPALRRDWCTREKTGKRAWSDPSLTLPRQGSYYSLLGNLGYVPSTRYQGACGDCWVWAGVGCLAIELERLTGTKDRLSVQHLNSCGTNGYGQYPCCGGWAEDLADFFDAVGYCLPWSNSNASFADSGRNCSTGSPAVGCAAIAKTPRHEITSCSS